MAWIAVLVQLAPVVMPVIQQFIGLVPAGHPARSDPDVLSAINEIWVGVTHLMAALSKHDPAQPALPETTAVLAQAPAHFGAR